MRQEWMRQTTALIPAGFIDFPMLAKEYLVDASSSRKNPGLRALQIHSVASNPSRYTVVLYIETH